MYSEAKSSSTSRQYATILGVKITSTARIDLLKQIQEKLSKKQKFTIFTPNPEIILKAQNDKNYLEILNSSDFNIPDGEGLRLADNNLEIIKGRELVLDLLGIANMQKLKVYILGGTEKVNKDSLQKILKIYPNIIAKGNSGPIYNDKADPVSKVYIKLENDIVKEINAFKPDVLFIALGAPKQEYWISKNKNKINAICFIGVGGAFDYFSGSVRKVPVYIENLKLEWLWRLAQDPKRIKRIINAVIIFPTRLFLNKMGLDSN